MNHLRWAKLGLVVAAAVVSGVLATSADAVNNWRNNAGIAYPARSPYPAASGGFWVSVPRTVQITFNGGGTTISCSAAQVSGDLAGPGGPYGATGPTAGTWQVSTVTLEFYSCSPANSAVFCNGSLAGAPPAYFTTGLAPGAYNGGVPTTYGGAASGGIMDPPKETTGTLVDIECAVYYSGGTYPCVTVRGTTNVKYTNPSSVGGTLVPPNIFGRPSGGSFRIFASGQSLAVSGARCPQNTSSTAAQIVSSTGGDVAYNVPYVAPDITPVIWYGTL